MIKPNKISIAFSFFLLFLLVFNAVKIKAQNTKGWLTPAEQTDYKTTPRYNETFSYLTRLDNASPNVKLTTFGKSGEGRDLLLVVAARNDAFTPEKARQQGKVVVLIQACIHAGESDGKDAGLALLADIAINKTQEKLLDKVVLLFEPIYNVDGHERFGAFNRINQNGPEEAGFRSNARNINLNRDYMKADEPETRSWLRLWNEWQPDFFIDCHVTDGADYQYNLTYQFEHHETVAPAIKNWLENAIEKRAVAAAEADGNLLAPYLSFRDNRDLKKGIDEFLTTGRYATGYPVLRNRPAVLIETHMIKPYKNRVRGTYDFIRAMLAEINRDPNSLLAAVKSADAQTVSGFQSYNAANKFPLSLGLTDKSTLFPFKGVASRTELSEISGDVQVIFDNSKSVNLSIPYYNETKVATWVAPPLAYLVPPQWAEVIERLELHNLKIERLNSPQSLLVETYRLTQPKWAPGAFESRIMLRDFKIEKVTGVREFPAGSALVRLQQPAAQVAIHLLEPGAPDSLVRWGFFNSIFEQKEYAESYVLEKMAREMLAKDVSLQREFEEKLKTDSTFAASPNARLNFFFEHSPYADKNIGLYPVGRVLQNVMLMQNVRDNKRDKKDKKDKKRQKR
jgi:hypothetical protein